MRWTNFLGYLRDETLTDAYDICKITGDDRSPLALLRGTPPMILSIAATAVPLLATARASNILPIDPEGKLVEGDPGTLARKLGRDTDGQSPLCRPTMGRPGTWRTGGGLA